MLPIGTLSPVFGKKPGNWVVRISTPAQVTSSDIASAADHAARQAGFRLERHPQKPPAAANR